MQLYNNTFDSFSSANYVIANLNRGINTSYIPSGDNINEVISNFTKIQLSRSFNPNCGLQANLGMQFDENAILINYSSTSGTTVSIEYKFNNNMEVEKVNISVWLPDDRAESGRCHYETLTQELYTHKFLKVDWENEKADVELPYELLKLNDKEDWNLADNIPNWVYEQQSNFLAHWNLEQTKDELLALGYAPCDQPIGFTAAWYSPTNYYSYVVLYERLHPVDNNYYLLTDRRNKLDITNGGVSYKRLLEILANQGESRRSRRNRTSDTVIEQDNDLEDYEYDENEIEIAYDEE